MTTKPLDDAALDQLFRTARTYNGYTDQPVSEAELRAIWDLMKMGPTSANQMPARLVWCVSDEAKAKLAAAASEGNRPKILAAPVSVEDLGAVALRRGGGQPPQDPRRPGQRRDRHGHRFP